MSFKHFKSGGIALKIYKNYLFFGILASGIFTLNSCSNVSLTEIVETAENPKPTKIVSLVEKTIKNTATIKEKSSGYPRRSYSGGIPTHYESLFSKVRYKLEDTPAYSDNFDSYGLGQMPPYGKWVGDAPIKTLVSYNKMITKVANISDHTICLTPKFKNFYISLWVNSGRASFDRILAVDFRKIRNMNINYRIDVWVGDGGGKDANLTLYKVAEGSKYKIAENKIGNISKLKWHKFELYVNDGKIIVYIDGQEGLNIVDNDPALQKTGEICISGWSGSAMDDFTIYSVK